MITNERQYRITRSWVQKFQEAIRAHADTTVPGDVDPRLFQVEREALEGQLATLQEELAEYERLKSAGLSEINTNSFEEFAEALIKARIANGLSQKALAERLNIKEQQIQRYEAERYASASYRRLCEIVEALGVRIRNQVLLPPLSNRVAESPKA